MKFDWPYYDLINGKLYIKTRQGLLEAFYVTPVPLFANSAEAEEWLKDNDHRGNVR